MRIGIDTLSILPGRIGGGETYLVNLFKGIKEDKANEYYLFVNHQNHHVFPSSGNLYKILCRGTQYCKPFRLFWEQFILPLQILIYRIDILFSPANISPIFFLPCKSVLTIHDLMWLIWKKDYARGEDVLSKFVVTRSAQRANKIIAVSERTKRDIVRILKLPVEKIVVIHEAVSDVFQYVRHSDKIELKADMSFHSDFILSVGTTHHHKNFLGLLNAYKLLKEKRSSFKYKLVIAGMPGHAHSEVLNRVKTLKLEEDVIIKGYVSTEELKALYCTAELFVFPSLYEGFGLPLLEAMASGTPIVSSDAASLPEVGGDAVIYFNPFDINDMAEKILMVLENNNLKSILIRKGYERIKNFSWEKAGQETLRIFEEVYLNKRNYKEAKEPLAPTFYLNEKAV